MSVRRTRKDDGSQWTVADSRSVYGIRHWGAGYFAINDAGRVEVRPNGPNSAPIDLFLQVEIERGAGVPSTGTASATCSPRRADNPRPRPR